MKSERVNLRFVQRWRLTGADVLRTVDGLEFTPTDLDISVAEIADGWTPRRQFNATISGPLVQAPADENDAEHGFRATFLDADNPWPDWLPVEIRELASAMGGALLSLEGWQTLGVTGDEGLELS